MKKKYTLPVTTLVFLLTASFAIGQPLNYTLTQNWMCHPVLKSTDASQLSLKLTVKLPDMTNDTIIQYTQPTSNTGVDIFYVYPTMDFSLAPGNTAFNDIDTAELQRVFRQQAGLYSQFGRVFAPYYRQINIGTYALLNAQSQANLFDTAYRDVEAAFLNYLNNYNNGNKFILIGHSQGGEHVQFLLRKLFDNNPALRSQLIVAISGGSFHFNAQGSRTGGILQNIKVCPPLDSGFECGCIMTWRSYKYGTTLVVPSFSNPGLNQYLVSKGMQYSTYDTLIHEEKYFDFGYDNYKVLTRYITLNPVDSLDYWGFDNMYAALDYTQVSPPAAGLYVQNIQSPGDQRPDQTIGTNFHNYDMKIVQGDLLNIIPAMIAHCNTTATNHTEKLNENIEVFPNPVQDKIYIRMILNERKNISIQLFDVMGRTILAIPARQYSESSSVNASTEGIPAGIYLIRFISDDNTITQKIVIE